MKQNKDEFRCVYEFENVYGCLAVSIWLFFMAILMVLIMIIEKEFGITIAVGSISLVSSIACLITSFYSRDKIFVINREMCKVESKKGDLYAIKIQDIRRIVDLESSRGRRCIIFDCEAYPYLAGVDLIFRNVFYIRYTSRRLKEIRKYCSHCVVERERTNYFTTEDID